MKIGIIGFGSMGKMLADGFVSSNAVPQKDLYISSRTLSKIDSFQQQYSDVNVSVNNSETVKNSDIVFLCTPPNQIKSVLIEIAQVATETKYIVSMAAYISLQNIESIISKAQISKVIPSFVSEVKQGVFLACHNGNVKKDSIELLDELLGKLGKVYEIDEDQFEVYTDITSCSPGILSAIFKQFIDSAGKHGNIDGNKALEMFIQTLYGLSKIYYERRIGFSETIQRVARKGGITEIGISVVNEKAPALFDEIFEKTIAKHEMRKQEYMKEFS